MERIGHRLARDQETLTWRIWTDYIREDLKGENIQKLPGLLKRPKNEQKGSLEESCESLIVGTADGREDRRDMTAEATENSMYVCLRLAIWACVSVCLSIYLSVCRQFVCMWSVRRPLTVVVFDCIALVSFSVVLTRPLTSGGGGRGQLSSGAGLRGTQNRWPKQ